MPRRPFTRLFRPHALRLQKRRLAKAFARARGLAPAEFEQIIIRYLLGLLITGYVLAAYLYDHLHDYSGPITAVIIGLAWILGLGFLVHLTLWPERVFLRRTASIITDAAMLSLVLGFGGESTAVLFPIYLWVTLGNGFRFGVRYLHMAIAANLTGFVIMALLTPYWREAWEFSTGLAMAILIIPLYPAKLIRNLHEAKNDAEEASRAKTEFLSMISHELRTPLTAILGLAQVTKATAASARERFSAISIELAAGRLLRMVDTILKFQRIESGAAERDDKPFDLLDVLNAVRAIIEPLAAQKGLYFAIQFKSGLPELVQCDPDYVETIMLNLLTNAVKYTNEGGVSLEIGMSGDTASPVLRLAVKDTGIGIPENAQARIFDKFVRGQKHNVASEPGVGLGLATCKSLSELLDGTMGFESAPGAGSHFWVELPVHTPAAGTADIPCDAKVAPIRVLDDAANRIAAGLPDAKGMSGSEILDQLAASDPSIDACVLVVDAGGIGAALRKALLQRGGDGPAIVLTGRDGESDASLARLACGVSANAETRHLQSLVFTAARWHRRVAQCKSADHSDTAALARALTVLVADDNALNQQVVRRMLELDGHRVIPAETGDQALELLFGGGADLAFLDVNMPGMSGIEVCQAYRTGLGSASLIPLVGLTADISEQTRRDCLRAGMSDVLAKPVTFEQLRKALSDYALYTDHPVRDEKPALESGEEARIDSLKDLFGGSAFAEHFLPSFERDLSSSLENLKSAAETGRAQGVRDALHAIKSSASTAGAHQILAAVERFSTDGKAGNVEAFSAEIMDKYRDYKANVLSDVGCGANRIGKSAG